MILVQWTGTKDTLKKVKCHRMYISFGQPTGQQKNQSISCRTDGDKMIERKHTNTRARTPHRTHALYTAHQHTRTHARKKQSNRTSSTSAARVISEAVLVLVPMPVPVYLWCHRPQSIEMCLQPFFGYSHCDFCYYCFWCWLLMLLLLLLLLHGHAFPFSTSLYVCSCVYTCACERVYVCAM